MAGSTVVGALIGSAVPDELPLDFAVPLVFLVLLVMAITSRPADGGRRGRRRSGPAASRGQELTVVVSYRLDDL